jgi:DNA-directed RNA polymerase specialized sigma subunit
MIVNPITLSESEMAHCLSVMRRGNKLLKKWAKLYGFRKGREFRNLVFKGDTNPGECIPKNQLRAFRRDLKIILSIRTEPQVEVRGLTVEMAMLAGFIRLAGRHARRWWHAVGGMDYEDFESESALALIDAIYGFIRDDITFSTYAWTCLRNRMIYSSNKLNKLSPFTNNDRELLIRFEEARMGHNERVSFNEVVAELNLSSDEISLLNNMLTRVVSESQMDEGARHVKSSGGNDYTALRNSIRASDNDQSIAAGVSAAVKRANLTEFEQAALDTSLNPYYGWQTDIAEQHINPTTGNPYTRAGTGVALKNARAKVRQELEEAA